MPFERTNRCLVDDSNIPNEILSFFFLMNKQITLSLQLESIDRMLRQTELMLNAGDQSSVKIDKQICPFE